MKLNIIEASLISVKIVSLTEQIQLEHAKWKGQVPMDQVIQEVVFAEVDPDDNKQMDEAFELMESMQKLYKLL